MRTLFLVVSALFAGSILQAKEPEQAIVAKRFALAMIAGEKITEGDFSSPLDGGSLKALSILSYCRLVRVGPTAVADPSKKNVYVETFDKTLVMLKCKGVPDSTPPGLTLTFENGKIKQIATHNLDLIRQD